MIIALLTVFVAPTAVFALAAKALDRLCDAEPRRARRRPARSSAKTDLERYGRDLRRLAAEHDRLTGLQSHSTAFRLRSVGLAYDDTLRDACRVLELEVPGRPMTAVERLQAEADLVVRGVSW